MPGFLLDLWLVVVLGQAVRRSTRTRDGRFDTPTNTHLAVHIFVADKGDYYEVGDSVTQFQQLPQ